MKVKKDKPARPRLLQAENVCEVEIADILTITTEHWCSNPVALADLLAWMTHVRLFEHQWKRAREVCRPALLEQHPRLANYAATPETWIEVVEQARAALGPTLPVRQLAPDVYEIQDAIEELREQLRARALEGIILETKLVILAEWKPKSSVLSDAPR